ncbi:GNAT family N-acetyltransferase [Undibacterium sp. SXout7W]|uniref:GNAT family N-acetyltransferase n=1 Tax=Undibacterium sp. SXout7W TaxID=3413049 RepID=UPI003BF06DB1
MMTTYPVMEITTQAEVLDMPMIHAFLSEQSGWARGIPLATVKKSLQHSLCFGGLIDGKQMAFARVVTDHATFAYLMDVFVLPEWRHQGHGKTLLNNIQQHYKICAGSCWSALMHVACIRNSVLQRHSNRKHLWKSTYRIFTSNQ